MKWRGKGWGFFFGGERGVVEWAVGFYMWNSSRKESKA